MGRVAPSNVPFLYLGNVFGKLSSYPRICGCIKTQLGSKRVHEGSVRCNTFSLVQCLVLGSTLPFRINEDAGGLLSDLAKPIAVDLLNPYKAVEKRFLLGSGSSKGSHHWNTISIYHNIPQVDNVTGFSLLWCVSDIIVLTKACIPRRCHYGTDKLYSFSLPPILLSTFVLGMKFSSPQQDWELVCSHITYHIFSPKSQVAIFQELESGKPRFRVQYLTIVRNAVFIKYSKSMLSVNGVRYGH